jgi:hypothetical protein
MTLNIVLLVVALLLGVFAFRYVAVRFGKREYGLGILAAAIAVALVIFVITRSLSHTILRHAYGTHHWAHHGLVRGLLVAGISVLCGMWMYYLYRSRYKD